MSAFLHPFSPPRKTEFINIVGGEGAQIWDDRGNRYIDGMASASDGSLVKGSKVWYEASDRA